MKTSSHNLYPNDAVGQNVTAYAEEHSTQLPQHIIEHHAWVVANHDRSSYMISNFQSQCHVFLARALGVKRVLEIGVYAGYSALVWAHAVGVDGSVTGLENSPEYVQMAKDALDKYSVKNADIVSGDAIKTLETLQSEEPFDLIFIDAQKSGYPTYLRTILDRSQPGAAKRLLRPGGLIVADNVLRRALVADESPNNPWSGPTKHQKSEYEGDRDLEFLREYNDAVRDTERLDAFLMPLYDGVGMARLLD